MLSGRNSMTNDQTSYLIIKISIHYYNNIVLAIIEVKLKLIGIAIFNYQFPQYLLKSGPLKKNLFGEDGDAISTTNKLFQPYILDYF